MLALLMSVVVLGAPAAPASDMAEPGTRGRYLALTCKADTPVPFEVVEVTRGPGEKLGDTPGTWLQIRGFSKEQDTQPALQVRFLTAGDPFSATDDLPILRYIVDIPEAGEAFEYRNVHTRRALQPPWGSFQRYFLPHVAQGSGWRQGLPLTATYLGHVLTLKQVQREVPWTPLEARTLDLDPELLVGTARNFKDQEGHRLPQKPERKNYTYIPFTADDYKTMIEAGSNIFLIGPDQEQYVRGEPVFYIRNPSAKAPMRWPADFHRSNYLGSQMFLDEPAIITVGDKRVNTKMVYFSDYAAVVRGRVHEEYTFSRYALDKAFRDMKVNLGDMRLESPDHAIWETLYETSFYQMASGAAGIVHEGRYKLEDFTKEVSQRAGVDRKYTVEEMLRYYYATLRGGSRPFGKYWGTAIYGQCDPTISPTAIAQAYDMGARYIWFWTSDHEHHLPWVEQMELTRGLRRHQKEHPRPSILGAAPVRDLAIVVPYGYFLSLENLWFIRELDPKGENESSVRYRKLLNRGFQAVNEALDRGEDFDITVDDGRDIVGYQRVIRLADEPAASVGMGR